MSTKPAKKTAAKKAAKPAAKVAKKAAKKKVAAKAAPAAAQEDGPLAPGTAVKFLGYKVQPPNPKMQPGDLVYTMTYYPEQDCYDVGKKPDSKKALDAVYPGEWEAAAEEQPELLLAGETGADSEAPPAKGKRNAPPTVSKTTVVPFVIPDGPLKRQPSVVAAIKAADGDAVAAALACKSTADNTFFTMGGVLDAVKSLNAHHNILKGDQPMYSPDQKGFQKFVSDHMGMKWRKAEYYVDAYRTLTALGVDEKKIHGLGWSKVNEALPFLKAGGAPDEAWEMARTMDFVTFKNTIKTVMVERGMKTHGNTGNGHEMTTFKVRLFNDRAAVLNAALDLAAELTGVTKPSEDPEKTELPSCLMHIVDEWYAMRTASALPAPTKAAAKKPVKPGAAANINKGKAGTGKAA